MSALVRLTSRRDLAWRKRRLVIAIVGTSLAFALTLLLSGFREGIDVEAIRTLRAIGADGFVVREGVSGPFTTVAQVDASLAEEIAGLPGVLEASPLVTVRHAIESGPITDVYMIGAVPGRVGMPSNLRGRPPSGRGETALGTAAGRRIGDEVSVGGRPFRVVGLLDEVSVWANVPVMFVTITDAQDLIFNGREAATSIAISGTPTGSLGIYKGISSTSALVDLKRPLANAITTIDLFRILLWVVAAAIVGSILYISALERSRDFAVLKAVGTSDRDLVGTLIVEAVTISAASALVAIVAARPMATLFPALISFPARSLLLLPVVAIIVGVVGGLAGARRAASIDPALAFSGR